MNKLLCLVLIVLGSTAGVFAQDMSESMIFIEDNQSVIVLSVEDGDVSGDAMLDEAEDGEVISVDDQIVFTPSEEFDGETTITYEVCDDDNVCVTKTVVISELDDEIDYIAVATDSETIITTDDLEDGEIGDIVDTPDYGEITIVDGELIYTADEDYEGIDTFSYEVCNDGSCEVVTTVVKVKRRTGGNATAIPTNPVCGDNFVSVQNKEQCDDGNKVNGDGCSSTCILEEAVVIAIKEDVIVKEVIQTVTQDLSTTNAVSYTRKKIDIERFMMPYMGENDKALYIALNSLLANKTNVTKVKLYKILMEKFPAFAFTRYKINKRIFNIVLQGKINETQAMIDAS